ncbi:methyl-accepting chemotaxis protein [Oceanobacillus halotolerans]|uniref:methyl-accepting chemotaxis protein n=1 Tax=Oceanobacillus halotolerans TaxID=2663380 RepID=UPI0013DCF296
MKLTNYQPENEVEIFQDLQETRESDSSIENIYTGFEETGDFIIYPEVDVGADFNVKDREWYADAMEADGEIIWTAPYVDEVTGKTVVSAAKAYYHNDKLAGVVGADVVIDTLIEMIKGIEIGETGYAAAFDNSGNFLAHPDEEYVGEDVSEEEYYKDIVKTGESGIVKYEFEGDKKITGFVKNPTTGWILAGTVSESEFQNKAQAIILPITISLAVVIIIAIIISLIITRRITNPIKIVMERMKNIAKGDLSHEALEVKSTNEIGQLVVATNEMSHSMVELLKEINKVSETVSSHSEELTQSAQEVKLGSEQVATTMQEIASGTETQANHAGEMSTTMNTFTANVQDANENGEHIQQSSTEVLRMTNEGQQLMETSTKQMAVIDQIVHGAVQKVENLEEQSQKISKLVSVIKDVAGQTNLLALNAAIEAARAGEHGKGFAVVADEVRKLAEQVSESVTDITEIVTSIQDETNLVTESLQGCYQEVREGTDQIRTTGEKFNGIRDALNDMVDNVKIVTENLSDIAANSQQMNSAIQEISAVSEETAAGVEEVSASSQQTNSSMEEVASSSEQLAKLAEELNGMVHKFKL